MILARVFLPEIFCLHKISEESKLPNKYVLGWFEILKWWKLDLKYCVDNTLWIMLMAEQYQKRSHWIHGNNWKKMVLEHIIYCHVVLWDSFFNKEKIMVDWSKLIFHVLFCCGRNLFYRSNLQGSKVHLVHTPLSYAFLMLWIWNIIPGQ